MPGFDGTGPNGMGPMTGGGRGFCNPGGVVPRQYGFPRGFNYASPRYGGYGFQPYAPRPTREQEVEFLKSQAEALKSELKELEADIVKLSAEKE